MTNRLTLLICALFASLSVHAQFTSVNPSSQEKKQNTSVRLFADVNSIRPGTNFTVGVLMRMNPGWHTYWKNGGEAGLPTTIVWSLPEGFSAGEIQWPVPHKYLEEGDILTFGYEDENMLLVEMRVPNDVRVGSSVTLKANVSWLECEKICIPGSATVQLTLPVLNTEPTPNEAALFAKYRMLVPQPFAEQSGIQLSSSMKDNALVISLKSDGREFDGKGLDFYPEIIEGITAGRTQVEVAEREATIMIPLSADEPLSSSLTVRGVLVYQLQGEEKQHAEVAIPVTRDLASSLVAAAGSQSEVGGLLNRQFNTVTTGGGQQPLYVYIFFAIIGGLILNIMPCVLPVIALKVFGVVKMAGNQPREVRKLGVYFSLGILASFMVLALLVVILKAAGESVGWGFQFQEPLFVIAMGTIVFVFGLSLFGVYEIGIPGFALAGANALAKEGKSRFLGPFSEGVFATILATPCTAPILGSALGFAFAQPAHVVLLIFAATAFGMALPYLLLTARPAWMKFLPKPGEWMVTAKQFMGFLMMATLIWLLQILGSQLGMESVIWTSAFLLFVGIAAWIVGRFATLTASRRAYWLSWGAALFVVLLGYQLFITDIIKARNVLDGTGAVAVTPTEGIRWEPFSLQLLENQLNSNKPVFIDFTAEWCLTCKVNEKTVLADPAVIKAIEEKGIVPVKADWTNKNAEITKLLAKFGRSGVPLYVLFPAGKPNEPIILPEVITTGIVLEALSKAG